MANRFEQVDEVVADADHHRPRPAGRRAMGEGLLPAHRPCIAGGGPDDRADPAQGRAVRRRQARQRAQARDRRRSIPTACGRRNGANSTAGKMTPRRREGEQSACRRFAPRSATPSPARRRGPRRHSFKGRSVRGTRHEIPARLPRSRPACGVIRSGVARTFASATRRAR